MQFLSHSRIFLSGSSDITPQLSSLHARIGNWLIQHNATNRAEPYYWKTATDNGRTLADRAPIQQQLLDPNEPEILLTVCLFSERCGVPLIDTLDPALLNRFIEYRASPGQAGIVHPWPNTAEAEAAALATGGFPLTGTVFELFSALTTPDGKDNLVLGCVASTEVVRDLCRNQVIFGNRRVEHDIAPPTLPDAERETRLKKDYHRQTQALFNLLSFLASRIQPVRAYPSAEAMASDVMARLDVKLRQRFGFESAGNPFKKSLDHWKLDDDSAPPGRDSLLSEILTGILSNRGTGHPVIHLLEGPSGCGKSSLLQGGVLRRLRLADEIVFVIRPTDLALTGALFTHFLDRLCETIAPDWRPRAKSVLRQAQIAELAQQVAARLASQKRHLTIGLDQFEEILDELATTKPQTDAGHGWWAVIHFLAALLPSPDVTFVATLENRRKATFKTLEIQKYLNAAILRHDLDVQAREIRQIAESGFARARIILDGDLLEELGEKVSAFARDQGQDSSVLPLVGLWLAQLFDRFEYLAAGSGGGDFSASMNDAARPSETLTLEHLGTGPNRIDFGGMIARIAEEAWRQAGAVSRKQDKDQHDLDLHHLLAPLVGMDLDGRVRLLAAPGRGGYGTHRALLQSFRKARLLVPAGTEIHLDLVRLVHQSVLDRWEPARNWLERQQDYLEVEANFRTEAKRWLRKQPQTSLSPAFSTPQAIADAACILQEYRAVWPSRSDAEIGPEDADLRRFAIRVFEQADDPFLVVPGTKIDRRYAALAASYHLESLLRRFLSIHPECLQIRTKTNESLLGMACWTDGAAIDLLLQAGLSPLEDEGIWHPIAAAIVNRLTGVVDKLLTYYPDVNAPIGPGSTTILHVAAQNDCLHTLTRALARSADPKVQNGYQHTPLHLAASAGTVRCFEILLPLSDPLARDSDGRLALAEAASKGHHRMISFFLAALPEPILNEALNTPSTHGYTPLAEAAYYKRPATVQLLLDCGLCNPEHAVHTHPDSGNTLLHSSVVPLNSAPGEDEQRRARRTVEVLLQDGRIDPNRKNTSEKTAYERADAFPDAREVLRGDPRTPSDYASMSDDYRIHELTSFQPHRALRIIRDAPHCLSDVLHDKTGLGHIIEARRGGTLALAMQEGLISPAAIFGHFRKLAKLAISRGMPNLRRALLDHARRAEDEGLSLSLLLSAALPAGDESVALACVEAGPGITQSLDDMHHTILHTLAMLNRPDVFERLARARRTRLPRNGWGLPPSAFAPEASRAQFIAMEADFFDPPDTTIREVASGPSILHRLASKGEVEKFARIAAQADFPLPLDKSRRPPSGVAPEDCAEQIRALEERHFTKRN
ncbi:nSTAND1 domain-containing NTPase [Paragemmobacter ruber]|uniref:Novel STAND NTPase 1 domain-containing protein n=1 Tax=Paragemmobacter ruber TaxID=1985673 RepID=A0ABW9Y7E9_9RHOB|nr:ankyrin repeat domain-containing protein [Rhodobacter ruber]NBE07759.1 hypothetical protein [Rhodobacter ruber]